MDQSEHQTILDQLRAEIAVHGSVKQFSERSGIEYATMRRYLSGERQMPLNTLLRALNVLDILPTQFFARVEGRSYGDCQPGDSE